VYPSAVRATCTHGMNAPEDLLPAPQNAHREPGLLRVAGGEEGGGEGVLGCGVGVGQVAAMPKKLLKCRVLKALSTCRLQDPKPNVGF
jgi:hypothetical protein